MSRLGQRGDTIIEVLIAIAVISSVLGIVYSIMGSNLQAMRDNQERTEASKIAQGQLELLRAAMEIPDVREDVPADSADGAVCLESNGSDIVVNNVVLTGGLSNPCERGLYEISLRMNSSGGYTVAVEWDSLGGARGSVIMAYKFEASGP